MTQRLDRDGIETHSDNSLFIKASQEPGMLEASHNLIPPTIKHWRNSFWNKEQGQEVKAHQS